MFSLEELRLLQALISAVQIKGSDSVVVANLLIKITNLVQQENLKNQQSKQVVEKVAKDMEKNESKSNN